MIDKKTTVKEYKYNEELTECDMENDDPTTLQTDLRSKIEELRKGNHEIINYTLETKIGDFGFIAKILYK